MGLTYIYILIIYCTKGILLNPFIFCNIVNLMNSRISLRFLYFGVTASLLFVSYSYAGFFMCQGKFLL